MSKFYAQFDDNGVCVTVGTPNITGIEADYDKLGLQYKDGAWVEPEPTPEPEEGYTLTEEEIDTAYEEGVKQ